MSQRPIGRSEDLQRLRADGYTVALLGGLLLVRDIPYVTSAGAARDDGILVMPLTLAGDIAAPPSDHTAHFVGEIPCDQHGEQLSKIIASTGPNVLAEGITATCYFSAKPIGSGTYPDFYEKVTTYVELLEVHARLVQPSVTARRHRPVTPDEDDDDVFNYVDTASSRAGIDAITDLLRGERIGIIGVGGTGAYILDLVAKTPVAEIHLFDDDRYLTHNAFRSPGAPSLEQLEAGPLKATHHADTYSHMHRRVTAHPVTVDDTNLDLLNALTFVFVCVDDGPSKRPIFDHLTQMGIPFIDVGMGVSEVNGTLTGIVRTTTSTPEKRDHVDRHVSFGRPVDDEYRSNIQIADLNALNAALAVIRWKRYRGFYADLEREHNSLYAIDGNHLTNEDLA